MIEKIELAELNQWLWVHHTFILGLAFSFTSKEFHHCGKISYFSDLFLHHQNLASSPVSYVYLSHIFYSTLINCHYHKWNNPTAFSLIENGRHLSLFLSLTSGTNPAAILYLILLIFLLTWACETWSSAGFSDQRSTVIKILHPQLLIRRWAGFLLHSSTSPRTSMSMPWKAAIGLCSALPGRQP